uniref:Uncharacterized protein n=1 Tax=Arion vulgaris TaxID=1028688 RepID=A0A0B6Y7F0_9EUPU
MFSYNFCCRTVYHSSADRHNKTSSNSHCIVSTTFVRMCLTTKANAANPTMTSMLVTVPPKYHL